MITSPHPYPISSIGRHMSAAAREQSLNTGTAPEVTAIAALASAAAAAQGSFDVQRPDLPPSPISVLSFVSARSGSNKSTGTKPFVAPHEAMQRHLDEQSEGQREFEITQFHWKENLAYEQSRLRRFRAAGEPFDHVETTINELLKNKPIKPKKVQFLYQSPTPAGLRDGLSGWPFGFVIALDGGSVINGAVGAAYDFLNSAWDGETIRSKTADEILTVYDPRITALIFAQPGPTLQYFKRRGEDALGTGLLPRADWAFVETTSLSPELCVGTRASKATDVFQSRVVDLLKMSYRNRTLQKGVRQAIGFSQNAAGYFRDLRQRTLAMCSPGRPLQGLEGYAAKIAERVARYACIVHVFDDAPGLITEEELWHGEQIAQWYSNQLLNVLMEVSPHTQTHRDSQLLEMLISQALYRGESVRIADLSRIAPPDWGRPRRLKAWQMLQHFGRACLRQYRHTYYIQLASMPQPVHILQS